jgi:hypothetical protein
LKWTTILLVNANNGKGSANNGRCSQTNYKDTIDDNFARDTTKGTKVVDTTYDIFVGEIVEGVEARS